MNEPDIEVGNSSFSFRDVTPVDVLVQDLAVEFRHHDALWSRPFKPFSNLSKSERVPHESRSTTALHGVSASMPSGSLTAIIGGSGSGKTTLLNTMSSRFTTERLRVSGVTTFNGDSNLRTVKSSYVMQQDVLLPSLSPRETLQYAADLRLPSELSQTERRIIVEKVVLELGLKECADTRIGSSIRKGCSGGEKRRTSIGVQMLANPSVLFCDEPTTGVDAYSAFQVVKTLKKLADGGRTIIMSIHAPRSEIWRLFDRVILLSKGYTLYSGLADGAIPHFERCGYVLPEFVNPAEFLIDLAAIDSRTDDAERRTLARVELLRAAWNNRSIAENALSASAPNDAQSAANIPRAPFRRQLQILTARTIKVTLRDPMGITGSLFEAVSMSIITGWIFLNLDTDLAGIRSRQGSLYNASSLQGYLILLFECYRLTFDIKLFDREHGEGVVSVAAFLLSRRLSRLFLEDIPVPLIFSLIYYFMVGFRAEAATFFIFLGLITITQFVAVTLAMLCIAISRDFAGASLIANLVYTLQSIGCGFFVQANQIPVYVRWLKWTAYNFYIFGALVANEFIGVNGGKFGQFYDCPISPKEPTNKACQQYVGSFILSSLGLPSDWIWRPIIVAMAFPVVFYFGSWAVLSFWTINIGVAQPQKAKDDTFSREELVTVPLSNGQESIKVNLTEYALDVKTRRLSSSLRPTTKEIIRPITASFEPGKLNVIMGPSGSGKTSLLQSIALRLSDSLFSKYKCRGSMTFNGRVPLPDVVKSVVSFVTQDDDALMPCLTVRETLYFAAGLRLPSSMSKKEKRRRAEDIILKLGLKDAADNTIGSELKKGISGGEKRRVSIAIQILTNPKILLLDEPTSGLDAFTAVSIIDVLRALGDEGRTIVMTIHQARADVFQSFQNVLLLARGGSPVYSGSGDGMLGHFSALGFDCPRTSNPADFALDLITVDLQQEDREIASREKVQRLVKAWDESQNKSTRVSSKIATPAELSSLKRRMNSFWVTFPLVLRRSATNMRRQPDILLARVMQVVGIGLILALFYAPLQSNYESIQSRMGFIQQNAALYFVGMLQNLSLYPLERTLFYREDRDNCYTSFTFLLSYTALEVPFEILSSLIFGALAAFAVGIKRSVKVFLVVSFNCFAIVSCGESVGIIFCTIFSNHEGFSVTVMSVLLSIANIMGGILSINIPAFLEAWNWLSPCKYQIASLASYAMSGLHLTCSTEQRDPDGACPISTGEQVLELYNLYYSPGLYLLGVGMCAVVYRMVAFGVVWMARSNWGWDWGRKRRSRSEWKWRLMRVTYDDGGANEQYAIAARAGQCG